MAIHETYLGKGRRQPRPFTDNLHQQSIANQGNCKPVSSNSPLKITLQRSNWSTNPPMSTRPNMNPWWWNRRPWCQYSRYSHPPRPSYKSTRYLIHRRLTDTSPVNARITEVYSGFSWPKNCKTIWQHADVVLLADTYVHAHTPVTPLCWIPTPNPTQAPLCAIWAADQQFGGVGIPRARCGETYYPWTSLPPTML